MAGFSLLSQRPVLLCLTMHHWRAVNTCKMDAARNGVRVLSVSRIDNAGSHAGQHEFRVNSGDGEEQCNIVTSRRRKWLKQ